MPNWIITEIEITGERETLEKISNVIEQCNESTEYLSHNWVGYIFDLLGINTKKYAESRTYWYHPKINKHGHLVFIEESAWEKSRCAEALKQKFFQEISGINYNST